MSSAPRAALFAVGIYHHGFALFHLGFRKLFRWDEELARPGHVNRAVEQVVFVRRLGLRVVALFLVGAALPLVAIAGR